MDINRENAMKLWNERYGKELKVTDFAGRKMVKSAYGDRNSEFGWNLDHILPQSQGGKDTPSNLICCHILTNDEKADKFPTFVANDRRFEIVKVQNHYEIREVDESSDSNKNTDDTVDFFDPAAAMRFLKECENGCFVGEVRIVLDGVKNKSILDFISEIFCNYETDISESYGTYYIRVYEYDLKTKEEVENLLDYCVMANTYLGHYFINNGYLLKYNIYFAINQYDYHINSEKVKIDFPDTLGCRNSLAINSLVKKNTSAKIKNLANYCYNDFYEYNYIYTDLGDKLKKIRKENK